MIGESFSHYRVTGRLGSGGMGDVYRAEDTKLRRPVAIKVLPEAFARDEERMKRFEREAQVLASLNHPNVAAIYGLEDVGSVRALVLELVEGPTLAERIAAGPLSFEDARRIARQIALGLEAAHEKSIVHRDLKPANVKLTVDGDVKILDFGLAKAMEGEAASVDISHSPTMTRAATEAGFLLGTAAYMSPEQAKGKKVDRRTDIWAFGVVLFEMLTGRRLFAGETVSDILAAVLREEPPWQELPPRLSPALRWVLRRCLQKDPRERLHDIADARIELSEAHKDDALAPDRTRESPWPRRVLPWTVALAAAGVAAWIGLRSFSDRSSPETVAASILPPPNAEFLVERGFALSPDARQLVFAAEDGEGERALWLRSLASSAAQKLAGTEEGHSPFWSPDGRQVGFFANGKLKRIDLQSGLVENVTDHPTELGSGSWSSQGEIVFGGRGTEVELKRVLARGGVPEVVFPDGEAVERVLPSFLPDDGRFLFLARNYAGTSPQLRVGSLDGALEREVLRINSNAVYALSGHLVWWEDGNLREQRFDPGRLVVDGEPRVLAAEVEFDPSWGRGAFSLSGTTLVYHEGGLLLGSELVRFSRGGEELGTVGPPGNYYFPRLSPDGSRVAVDRSDEANRGDVWIYELERGTGMRLSTAAEDESYPTWSPDGSRVAYTGTLGERSVIRTRAAEGGGPDEELEIDANSSAWSPDGVLFVERSGDIWVWAFAGSSASPFLETPFRERNVALSRDGRMVAYDSDETGQTEVYVRTFPDSGRRWRVSTEGGRHAAFRRDGGEIYYVTADGWLVAVTVTLRPSTGAGTQEDLRFGQPQKLFALDQKDEARARQFDTLDGETFIVNRTRRSGSRTPLTLVLNVDLEERAPRPD